MASPWNGYWGRAHQLSQRIPVLFTRAAKRQTVSELLAVLQQALATGKR